MTRGKETCKILKEIRRQIADKNDIAYVTSECHYHGECKGTCPKCEAELQYLENELSKRRQLGKAVAVAGISLGLASTFPACNAPQQQTDTPTSELKNVAEIDTTSMDTIPITKQISFTTVGGIEEIEYTETGIATPFDWEEDLKKHDLSKRNEDEQMKELIAASKCNKDSINEKGYPMVGGIGDEYDAEFPGGMDSLYAFLQENIIYPPAADEARIQGTSQIQFVINKDGTVSDVKVVRSSSHPFLDKEAVRVVKLFPKWIPGKINGEPVASYCRIPIKFQLSDDEKIKNNEK